MDIASILGFLGAMGMVAYTMISGGGIEPFIDPASMTTVFGGTLFAVLYSHPIGAWGAGHGAMLKVFMPPIPEPQITPALPESIFSVFNPESLRASSDTTIAY